MKIRNINGTVAEVDDTLGKRLVAESSEWAKLRRTPAAPQKTDTELWLEAEAAWLETSDQK